MKFSFNSLLALQLTAVLAAQPQQKMTIAHWRKPEFTHEEFLQGFVEVSVLKLAKLIEEYGVPAMASVSSPDSSHGDTRLTDSVAVHWDQGKERRGQEALPQHPGYL